VWSKSKDKVLSILCESFTNRQLFKGKLIEAPLTTTEYDALCQQYALRFGAVGTVVPPLKVSQK
ncbi:MAG: hypothetical protein IIX99_02770, partial [Oscillospiraceae bacterium]|nr:hypothetical protein [Oscillospiraceae bacterium]